MNDQVDGQASPKLNVRQAAFIGVGAMVGAGIFSLLGAAGEVAGAAVWLSFLLAGAVAILQGYSFAKFGARYPSAGGFLEYVRQGFGNGHLLGIVAWLLLAANSIITAMVAVSFGSYASGAFTDGSTAWIKIFAVLLILVMTLLNIAGSQAVARTQTVIVYVVLTILTLFAVRVGVILAPFAPFQKLSDCARSITRHLRPPQARVPSGAVRISPRRGPLEAIRSSGTSSPASP